jgi:hypothetical protein
MRFEINGKSVDCTVGYDAMSYRWSPTFKNVSPSVYQVSKELTMQLICFSKMVVTIYERM